MTLLGTRDRRALAVTLVVVALLCSHSAYADNECGPTVVELGKPPVATCTTAGNPYPDGVAYFEGSTSLNIVAQPGVVVDLNVLGAISAMSARAPNGEAHIRAPNLTIDATNDPAAVSRNGIFASSGNVGDAVIEAGGGINIAGANDIIGIAAVATANGAAGINWSGPITLSGGSSVGINAAAQGDGNVLIVAAGDITGAASASGSYIGGMFGETGGSRGVVIQYSAGTITADGPLAYGIAGIAYRTGSSRVTTDAGTSIVINGAPDAGQNGHAAVTAQNYGGPTVIADIASLVQNTGGATPNPDAALNPIGIRAKGEQGASVTVLYSGLGITTSGGGGVGIYAASGSGNVAVESSGPITTNGTNAHGIFADSGAVDSISAPPLFVFPFHSPIEGARGAPSGVGGVLNITSTGPISTDGLEAHGIFANSQTGAVTVTAADTTTSGELSVGVLATGGALMTVNTSPGSVVRGGWQADPAEAGTNLFLPSAGVILGSRSPDTSILNNKGTIGALSDRAVTEAELFLDGFGPENLTINNAGTIVGYVTLGSGDAVFNNTSPNSLDLRNVSDTDGDGVRDHKAVAVSDFGAGVDQFNNEAGGAVRLLHVSGTTTTDTAGQFLPDRLSVHDSGQAGVEQGLLINLERFENRGLITLQDQEAGGAEPVAGDVLVITGGTTAGVSGGGVFLSDGGPLHIDTALNEGGAASNSDILVVDTTEVGPGGATRIAVKDAGGLGAPTPGDGIKVVDVLEPANSAAGAFTLGSPAVAGAYEYFLFQGGRADTTDGNWYLRSESPEQPEPPIPPTGPPRPPRPSAPEFRPEVPAYAANLRASTNMFVFTLHERLGEPQFVEDARPTDGSGLGSVWFRSVGRYAEVDPHGAFPFDASTDTWLLQGGLEFADWSVLNGGNDRLHLGTMAGYGEANSDASALGNPRRATAGADGYSFGGYATWYDNDKNRLGLYLDAWLQYGIFNNDVKGDLLPVISYDSKVFTTSLEAGYAFMPDSAGPIALEPQAQLIYLSYEQDDLIEPSTTHVSGVEDTWISRLGLRAHGTWLGSEAKYQPYLELNWSHDFRDGTVTLNTLTFASGVPQDRAEVGAGLDVEMAPRTTLWANANYQLGDNYQAVEGLVGAKYAW